MIFIGNWNNSEYGRELVEKYKESKYIKITPAVYDLEILNILRSNCRLYLHGHSAGGTNPSLVEAMFFGKPIIAFDCVYNRESTENKALYFTTSTQLVQLLNDSYLNLEENAKAMAEIAEHRYRWKTVTSQYEKLY